MIHRMKPLPPNPELEKAIEAAKKRWAKMTPEQQEAELQLQRQSWARQDMD